MCVGVGGGGQGSTLRKYYAEKVFLNRPLFKRQLKFISLKVYPVSFITIACKETLERGIVSESSVINRC